MGIAACGQKKRPQSAAKFARQGEEGASDVEYVAHSRESRCMRGYRGSRGSLYMPKITIVALPCNGIEPPLLPLATATSCLPLLL